MQIKQSRLCYIIANFLYKDIMNIYEMGRFCKKKNVSALLNV